MSTFDIRPDAPGLLRAESINVTIKFDRTGPTTGRISWNIPAPAPGCSADTQAYCGMLVTIDTKPASADKVPTRGEVYNSDATADTNLFAGDKLGTALVIGAFYEDRTTTFFDIDGLKPNTPYFVSGFPVDCQYRYFIEGVHSYSLDFRNRGTEGTNGTQVVVMNADSQTMGVNPDQYTGLDVAGDYEFTIQLGLDPKPLRPLDIVEVRLTNATYNITITGDEAQTYDDLVKAINRHLSLLKNAAQGPTAPNTGSYYVKTSQKKVFQWNGSEHVDIPALVEVSDPSVISTTTIWHDTSSDAYLKYVSPLTWTTLTSYALPYDPTHPIGDKTYWFDGTTARIWNGVTWCAVTTITSSNNPLDVTIQAGSFWYDDASTVLYRWSEATEMWLRSEAVQSRQNPSALTDGTYWFNDLTNALSMFGTGVWTLQSNVSLAEVAPSTPAAGKLWYKPTTMQLFRRNAGNTTWDEQDVIVHHTDPTLRTDCDVWWDVDTDTLSVWNNVQHTWTPATHFYIQSNDPVDGPTLGEGTVWYDGVSSFSALENGCFKPVEVVRADTDPTVSLPNGCIWFNTTTNTVYQRVGTTWQSIDPIDSPTNPETIALNKFWFNPSNSGLSRWTGAGWTSVTYSSTPLTPAKGTLWFDTVADTLKQWSGVAWIAATPIATVQFDGNSNLLFTDTNIGSSSAVNIQDISLFNSLELVTAIHPGKPGTDGASDEPMYNELGIGTDGSDAPRNAIITDLRYELGYPALDVELTQEQMDYAIDRAISELRSHSSLAYKRGFFFMSIPQNQQKLMLTSKRERHNRIVDVLGVYRLTSAFVSSAHGAGVYGQIVVQHLYNMGSFDLLSYHLMAEYTKLMEILFAGRVTYTWNEQTREIFLHNRFSTPEQMVCIEATEERTEQDLLSDRYTKSWIRRYAGGMVRLMLAEIRGKFSTLPGAGGSVSLNASDLRQAAQTAMEECMQEIADYVADRPEEYGMGTTFLFG